MSGYVFKNREELMAGFESMGSSELREELIKCYESERFYRSIFENNIDAHYRADMEGRLILCSPSTARMLGYDRVDELIGKNIAESFYSVPEERDNIVRDLMENGEVNGFKVTLKHLDGTDIIIEVNAKIVFSEAGEPVFIEGVFRDVTERTRTAERLHVSELFYRSLFENTGAATVLFDNEGLIDKANTKFEKLAGLPREDIEGKYKWTDFVDKEDLKRMWSYHQQRVQEGTNPPTEYEFTFVSHDGRRRYVQVNVDVVNESEYRTASLVDITKQRETADELAELNSRLEGLVEERTADLERKASQLEEANESLRELDKIKSSLLSTVSHELRTPLTSLLGFTKLISKSFKSNFMPLVGADPELRQRADLMMSNLDIINNEGGRLSRLLNDFLDLTRIESGRMRWNDEPVSLLGIVKDAANASSGDFLGKPGVSLRVELPEGLPEVNVDRDRVQQVILNLLNNAVKHTREGEVVLSANPKGKWVEVRVKDTGVGIPEEKLNKVFDTFYTLNVEDTICSAEGTGLGLAICQQIVEHYGGQITAYSSPGQGCEFVFTLPVVES